MKGRDPFAARTAITKAAGKGRLTPRLSLARGGAGNGPARRGVAGGHLAWSFVPFQPTRQWVQADVPPGIEQYDVVLVVGRNWDAFPDPAVGLLPMVADFDWDGANEDSAWTTVPGTFPISPFGVPDALWIAWASVGLGFMLVDGPGDLRIGGTHAWPQNLDGSYPDGHAQYVVLAFPSAYHNIPFQGPDSFIGFAGSGFWRGDFLGLVVPSWSWNVPSPNGLSAPYSNPGGQNPGYARVVVAFTHTGEANHLTASSYQGWAVEFSDFEFVILSRPYADQMTVTLPAVALSDCSVFVTSYWAPPGGGGGGFVRGGRLRGRPAGGRVAFERDRQGQRRRNPFA